MDARFLCFYVPDLFAPALYLNIYLLYLSSFHQGLQERFVIQEVLAQIVFVMDNAIFAATGIFK